MLDICFECYMNIGSNFIKCTCCDNCYHTKCIKNNKNDINFLCDLCENVDCSTKCHTCGDTYCRRATYLCSNLDCLADYCEKCIRCAEFCKDCENL